MTRWSHLPARQRDKSAGWYLLFLVYLTLGGFAVAGSLGLTDEMLDMVASEYGRRARARIVDWQRLVDESQTLSESEKLDAANRFFNKNRFVSDVEHWHVDDYWATPIEFLATSGGDCEDFAIAKYITLRALDVPEEKLRITYVKALRLNQAHMVLTYYPMPRAIPLVLDNLNPEILPADRRTDLQPVYSFNAEGLWLAKMRNEGQKIGTANDINMWRDLLARLQRERGDK